MKNLLIIGDTHGAISVYEKILNIHKDYDSIHVGDFGFKYHHNWHLTNIDSNKHKVNFGNHDDYTFLDKPHSLGNYGMYSEDIMTVRGAYSIDKWCRTEGIDWWSNEQLNYIEMQEAIDLYTLNKPKIMITHDCPQEVRDYMFRIKDKSLTSNGLQSMFEIHQPDIWIFGHHHKDRVETINGTKFICLGECKYLTL